MFWETIGLAAAFFGTFALYFLPFLIAWRRGHRNETPIGLVNLIFGWTVIGWIVALIWSTTDNIEDAG